MRRPIMTCIDCGSSRWNRVRRWYLGRTIYWWCDYCYRIIPPVRVLRGER